MQTTGRAISCRVEAGRGAALVLALVGALAIPARAAAGSADEALLLTTINTARRSLTVMLQQARAPGGRP